MQGFYTRIENDALDIAARLKEIDDGYFIVYNGYFKRLEVHNKKSRAKKHLCLVVPSNRLNARTVELVRRTSAEKRRQTSGGDRLSQRTRRGRKRCAVPHRYEVRL